MQSRLRSNVLIYSERLTDDDLVENAKARTTSMPSLSA